MAQTRNLVDFLEFVSTIEPKNMKESLKNVDWINLILEKLHEFKRTKVWDLVPRPIDRAIIRTLWVYKIT